MRLNTQVARAPLVLFIDDSGDRAYEVFLQMRGWRAATALNGQEGLAKAVALHPDAIVLDLWMPVMDGLEVARRLKGDPSTRAIPVIALTADVQDKSRERALAAGVDDFCIKPCAPPDLAATIQRFLTPRRARVRPPLRANDFASGPK